MTKSNIKKLIYTIAPALSIAFLILLWWGISTKNPVALPTFRSVYERFVQLMEQPIKNVSLWGHIAVSMKRVLIALAFSWTLGITLGVLIGWNEKCKAVLGSVFDLLRPIPPIAWIPLVIMWCGISESGKIIIVFIGTFAPVVINTSAGLQRLDPVYRDVGKIFRANRRQMLFDIEIQTAIPAIMAGLKTSVSNGWAVVLAAEMLGATSGIGFLVTRGWNSGDIPLVIICIVCIGIVGALLSVVLNIIERRVCPWLRV